MFLSFSQKVLPARKVKVYIYALILLAGVACKKDKGTRPSDEEPGIETPNDISPTGGSRTELIQDSIFLYARQVYMWWDKIPDYNTFKPRQYSGMGSELSNLERELFELTRYGVNPATNKPYEYNVLGDGTDSGEPKYSYINDITDENPIAYVPQKKMSVDLLGNGLDFGLRIGLFGEGYTNYGVYVEGVYPGSDAVGKVERGDRITVVNGRSIGTNYQSEVGYINAAFFGTSATLNIRITKKNGTQVDRTLIRKSFKSSPIYKDSVYTVQSKKIGYISYARFSILSDSGGEFSRIFSDFASKGVTDLIIDLRYNGGGYVSTAEELINYIAPASLSGKRTVMYAEHFNALMQAKKATILKKKLVLNSFGQPQDSNNDGKLDTYFDVPYDVESNTAYFQKKGSLSNIGTVVFLTTGSTASASELVINALKPYVNVKVVGTTSYGKPVGFFPIRFDKYDVYMSLFETKNAKGEGGYYSGITPDYKLSTNLPEYPFGDLNDKGLSAAYNFILNGRYIASTKNESVIMSKGLKQLEDTQSTQLRQGEFNGMIEDRLKIK